MNQLFLHYPCGETRCSPSTSYAIIYKTTSNPGVLFSFCRVIFVAKCRIKVRIHRYNVIRRRRNVQPIINNINRYHNNNSDGIFPHGFSLYDR